MKTIPLNIMASYPVKWTQQQVLRDIVQNFYDDIGFDNFYKSLKIQYKQDDNIIILSSPSDGFSYEWLLHMGASTKQENSGKFAGFFGEGFKMASLCALRNYNWKIKMLSRDWSLEVCFQETLIDGKLLKQLAYNIEEGCDFSKNTVLSIQNFSKDNADLLNEVILGFYFPENPLFGKCICKNEYGAIYERSNTKKPKNMPDCIETGGEGIVYVGFQARGSFKIPLVVCNHRFKLDDRDRNNIYFGTILDILIDIVDYIDAETACFLLVKFEKYWYDYPDKKSDVHSCYSLIRKLIRKMYYFDDNVVDNFKKKYPNLAVCERPRSLYMRNQRKQALIWKKIYLPNFRLVQDSFYFFSYKCIETLCEEAGGFNILRYPDIREKKLLRVLKIAAKKIFKDFFSDYPEFKIIDNESSVYNGTAFLLNNSKKTYNKYGYMFRYKIENIAIKKSTLTRNGFKRAFSTYCHELSHCFGGDSSCVFSRALTHVMDIILENNEILQRFNKIWIKRFDRQSHKIY
jgi:hypothetical protein